MKWTNKMHTLDEAILILWHAKIDKMIGKAMTQKEFDDCADAIKKFSEFCESIKPKVTHLTL